MTVSDSEVVATHEHPTAFARRVVTTCEEPTFGGSNHCWTMMRKHRFGNCRFRANGRIWMHCRECNAKKVEVVVVGRDGGRSGRLVSTLGHIMFEKLVRIQLAGVMRSGRVNR